MSAIGTIRSSARSTAKSLPKGEFSSVKYITSFSQPIDQGHSNFHIKLVGLPRTATPADITRLLAKNKIHNVIKGDHAMYRPASKDL
jgi:hypothetical protein